MPKLRAILGWVLAISITAGLAGPALALAPDRHAGLGASIAALQGKMRQIESDFNLLQKEFTAANLASDPSARAAAVAAATKTLDRLTQECSEAEKIYGQLQGSLPAKLSGASATTASTDLSDIIANLSQAEQNLAQAKTIVASLQ
ncbi:MAG TPA: hypothetical protein VKS78_13460 [Roseiarcus sp.]|nr:hypothetical protein [Roseiarcus sp.]